MIIINPALFAEIEAAAVEAFPEESCGLVIGHGNIDDGIVVTEIEVSSNQSDGDKKTSFEIDPQLRFNVMRKLNDSPKRIVGHFHSHPNGPAQPSARDNEQAWEPELIWMITSIEHGKVGQTAAFSFDEIEKQFHPLEIQIKSQ